MDKQKTEVKAAPKHTNEKPKPPKKEEKKRK